MYLKSLELHGFKSFPDKTTLTFERGATVIIGPNGSGKSNISDAMRWVLGEMSTKQIRGSKMEDVIFGGADTRRPMGYAEVSVTFDNTDKEHKIDSPYDEITVTRRYYRAGESDYFINRKPVRLRDIYELFLNTGIGREGYSIIGQGKIAEILSKKSEDRRAIFEEAAGISKYRYRKTETERRLAETEANMLRVTDILSELSERVGPLEKESEKAKKYLDLREEKKQVDVSLWLYDTTNIRDDMLSAENECKMSEHELEIAEDTLAALETQSDKLFEESQQNKLSSEKLISEIRRCDGETAKLETAYRVAENDIAHCKDEIAAADRRAAQAEGSAKALSDERERLAAEKEEKNAQCGQLVSEHERYSEMQKGCALRAEGFAAQTEEMLHTVEADEKTLADMRLRIGVLSSAKDSDTGKIGEVRAELEKYADEAMAISSRIESTDNTVKQYESAMADEDAKLASAADELNTLSGRIRENGDLLSEKRVSRDGLMQRVETLRRMEEHFEGYASSVRFVMQEYEKGGIAGAGKIYGPVSKLISTAAEYTTAIEIALGNNIQNVVTDSEETAKAAIRMLKKEGAGRATFYPLTSIRPQGSTEETENAAKFAGYVGRADTLVRRESKFDCIIEWLLGRTVVFEDIDKASAYARAQQYKVKTVTLDGQMINAGGSYTGGSVKRDGGILSRASLTESLNADAAKLETEIAGLEKESRGLEALFSKADGIRAAASSQRELLSALASAERTRAEADRARLSSNEGLREKLAADIAGMNQRGESYERDIEKLENDEKLLAGRIEKMKEMRASLDIERSRENDERASLSDKANAVLVKIASARAECDGIDGLLAANAARAGELSASLTDDENIKLASAARIADIERTMKDNRHNFAEMTAYRAELYSKRTETERGTEEYEKAISELRIRIREKQNDKELLFRVNMKNEARLTRLRADQEKLTSSMWEDYELTYSAALQLDYPKLDEKTRPAAAASQGRLRSALRALGNVNVNAIDEYASVKTRYDELTKQTNDLAASEKSLRDIISGIEGEMKRSFSAAFEQINENFGKVFAELFGGGTAELSLTDPDDVLGSGIEIKAAPPGKIIKSLMLLSGGEQAFVAIALLFAVLRVNPSPFCIFDEIEAALDEVNVARFADYIKHFGSTQFILITHRRGTMEAADRMYGVTMPEQGVSKVIALNVYEFEKRRGEFTDGVL